MINFGTGGWRAIIGEGFTKADVMLLSQGLANIIKQDKIHKKEFVIGYDRRFLSDRAAVWISEVMAGNGIKVYLIDRIAPTPLVMFTVKSMELGYGAAVTASHNPAYYNGVKIFTAGGRDATEEFTKEIENRIGQLQPDEEIKYEDFELALKKGTISIINPFNDYIDTILDMIDIEAIRNKNIKILLDPMFGVSKTCLQAVLITARCELDVINDRHDTLFGGRLPSPSSLTLGRLKDMVTEKHYDLGIGTDGDADRLGIIDEKGNFIHPNNILALLYYYLLEYKGWKGGVVRNVATTHLLDKIARAFGEKCHEVPVGFKHISEKMEKENALIGGESSGGLTIRGHIMGKDGIFAASLLVEMICVSGKRLSMLMDEINSRFGYLYYEECDFTFSKDAKSELIKILYAEKKLPDFQWEIDNVSYMDGIKVYFKNGGWIIARFSGTEPLLRIIAEMDSQKNAALVCSRMSEFLDIEKNKQ